MLQEAEQEGSSYTKTLAFFLLLLRARTPWDTSSARVWHDTPCWACFHLDPLLLTSAIAQLLSSVARRESPGGLWQSLHTAKSGCLTAGGPLEGVVLRALLGIGGCL